MLEALKKEVFEQNLKLVEYGWYREMSEVEKR